ncbi:MAG TPA: M24 family metallopeptidase, partial [Candidatus Binatia bacterium]|nr:M24 family metallopeptidase [Candidatus Binatia bacterium]
MAGIKLKSADDLKLMRPACLVAGTILDEIAGFIQPGVTTRQVDNFAAERIRAHGAKSAFLGYRKFPCHTCLSVNDEVVHGIASDRELKLGDIVSVDVGVTYKGFIGDNARTVPVGGCSVAEQQLLDVTEQSLYLGIAQAKPGNRVVDISRAV